MAQLRRLHREERRPGTTTVCWANISIDLRDGPDVNWGGCDVETLDIMSKALRVYTKAVRAGDDPDEIMRMEWERWQADRAAEIEHRAGIDLALGLPDTEAARAALGGSIPPAEAPGA